MSLAGVSTAAFLSTYTEAVQTGALANGLAAAVVLEDNMMRQAGLAARVDLTPRQTARNAWVEGHPLISGILRRVPVVGRRFAVARPQINYLNLRNWLLKGTVGQLLSEAGSSDVSDAHNLDHLKTEDALLDLVTDALAKKKVDYAQRASRLAKESATLGERSIRSLTLGGAMTLAPLMVPIYVAFSNYVGQAQTSSVAIGSVVSTAAAAITIALQKYAEAVDKVGEIQEVSHADMFRSLGSLIDNIVAKYDLRTTGKSTDADRRLMITEIIKMIETIETNRYASRTHGLSPGSAESSAKFGGEKDTNGGSDSQVTRMASDASGLVSNTDEVGQLQTQTALRISVGEDVVQRIIHSVFEQMFEFDIKARLYRVDLIGAATTLNRLSMWPPILVATAPVVAYALPEGLNDVPIMMAQVGAGLLVSAITYIRRVQVVRDSFAAGPARKASELTKHRLLQFLTDAIPPEELSADTLPGRLEWLVNQANAIRAEFDLASNNNAIA